MISINQFKANNKENLLYEILKKFSQKFDHLSLNEIF